MSMMVYGMILLTHTLQYIMYIPTLVQSYR